jgi:hypothetical protein
MPPKKIKVDGVGGVKLSNDYELNNWLIRKKGNFLVDSEGDEIGDFESLDDDGKYTLQLQQQPNGKLRCCFCILVFKCCSRILHAF